MSVDPIPFLACRRGVDDAGGELPDDLLAILVSHNPARQVDTDSDLFVEDRANVRPQRRGYTWRYGSLIFGRERRRSRAPLVGWEGREDGSELIVE